MIPLNPFPATFAHHTDAGWIDQPCTVVGTTGEKFIVIFDDDGTCYTWRVPEVKRTAATSTAPDQRA